jgi:tRNA threonylcarbamoyladenosine biosynthesis protein TsaB
VTVLGFDTATLSTSVALRLADGATFTARDDPASGGHPGHATRLLALADGLLDQADIAWRDLERIAVGVGPGRFTGLRVGVATARALAQSLSLSIVPVSSLRALAHGAAREFPHGGLLAVIDARRGEVFAAAYAPGEGAEESRELDFAAPLRPAEIEDAVARANAHAHAEHGCVAIGDGALCYRAELERAGALVPPDGAAAHLIDAAIVCEIGARAPGAGVAEVAPDYRREADAAIAAPASAVAGSTR